MATTKPFPPAASTTAPAAGKVAAKPMVKPAPVAPAPAAAAAAPMPVAKAPAYSDKPVKHGKNSRGFK